MFSKKRLPDLTNEAYERWLRAQRPPFEWFLRLSEVEQEQLAMLGDAHAQDFAVACGYAIRDPEAADAGMSALQGDDEAEATLAMKMAQGFASKLMQMQQPQEPPRPRTQRTMAGFGERRAIEENKAAGPTLWGVEAQQA
jgi:hypothetical protein